MINTRTRAGQERHGKLALTFCPLKKKKTNTLDIKTTTTTTATMQGTMPGARRRGRPRTAWMDNIKTWTGLSVEQSDRMTEDRDKWRMYVHGVANPRIEDG